MIDVVFVIPSNPIGVYQSLSKDYSAIETPTWALLLAQAIRAKGFKVAILDSLAENLNYDEVLERINKLKPRIINFVVYGQNVSAGTTSMSGAVKLSNYLKENTVEAPIVYTGSHVQALPIETLETEDSIDIVLTNEGVYSLLNLLALDDFSPKNLEEIKGIGFRNNGKPYLTLPQSVVPQEKMDIDLPGYAWDLLPYKIKPFDLYRSPMWHAEYDHNKRTPYAALQTSLGCRFGCSFCMINMINRNDNDEIGVSSNYSNMRYWSPEFIIKEFDKLIYDYGVKTIRIVDEMFLLNPKYYLPLCKSLHLRNKNNDLRMWAYSRVDTIKRPGILDTVRKAGIKWLCLGIESGNKEIRLEVSKGKFEDVDIKAVVNQVHEADINIMANYIYGLPGDSEETIRNTFNLSKDLCTLGWNTYTAVPLPGSALYKNAIDKGIELPDDCEGYSWHSYNTKPLPTEYLNSSKILELRDKAFLDYHSYPPFLEKIENKFGKTARENIINMSKIKLKRKLLEKKQSFI